MRRRTGRRARARGLRAPTPSRRHPSPRSNPTRRNPSSSASSRTRPRRPSPAHRSAVVRSTCKAKCTTGSIQGMASNSIIFRSVRIPLNSLQNSRFRRRPCSRGARSRPGRPGRRRRPQKSRPPGRTPFEAACDRRRSGSRRASPASSIAIAELDTGHVVSRRIRSRPETIASVTKMFSTAAALHFLGPDYKFKTTVWRRGEVRDGSSSARCWSSAGETRTSRAASTTTISTPCSTSGPSGLKQAGIVRVAGT